MNPHKTLRTWTTALVVLVGLVVSLASMPVATVHAANAPVITSVLPSSGSAAGGDVITINGTDFVSGATVAFNGVQSGGVTFVSDTVLNAIAPAGYRGLADVTVSNPDSQTATLARAYSYIQPVPSVTSVTPSASSTDGGTAMTLNGSGFTAPIWVKSTSSGGISLFNCSVDSAGRAYCWGQNVNGELGNNSTTDSLVPVAVDTSGALNGKTVTNISAGQFHACALTGDGKAYCWGQNTNGELGNNSTTGSLVPVAVDTSGALNGKVITSIDAGDGFTCALASDGTAYCWGKNQTGQLGNNGTARSLVPVAVDTSGVLSGKTITTISAGGAHTCALTSDGTAYCWGNNASGQLGINSTTQKIVPTAVSTAGFLSGKLVTGISAGENQTCAVTNSGLAGCWGNNSSGQLGDNSITQRLVPTAVYTASGLAGKTVTGISTAANHTCATTSNGTAYCWGANNYGRLGNNSKTDSLVPVAVYTSGVLSGKPVTAITTGAHHTCALANDGQVYCWGTGNYGQLGAGSTTTSTVPVSTNTTNLSRIPFTLKVDGQIVPITASTATTVSFTSPAHAAGSVGISLEAPYVQTLSQANSFEYGTAPSITSVTPSSGDRAGGDTITISGANFAPGATVTIGGNAASNVQYINDTTLMAQTPAGIAGARDITVTNPNTIAATLGSGFFYTSPLGMADGLVGWWKLNGNGNDATSYAHNGTVVSGTSIADRFGTANGAYSFSGSGYVQVAADNTFRPTRITVSAWVNPSSLGTSEQKIVSTTQSGGYSLYSTGSTADLCPAQSLAFVVYAGGYQYACAPNSSITNNTWVLLTGTYDGSNVKLYINDTLVATTPYVGTITHNANVPFCIGNEAADGVCTGQNFIGSLDDIRLFNRALTATEVAQLYVVKPPFVTSVAPSSGSAAGGDTITITGSNFANGANVQVGANAATNVTVVNSMTITATTPVGPGGSSVTVTVTNPDGLDGDLTSAYTYATPPLAMSSVAPNFGSTSGGQAVTLTGSQFAISQAATANSWSDTGVSLGTGNRRQTSAIVGSNIYLYGGQNGSKRIQVAPVSDPSTVTTSPNSLPIDMEKAQFAQIGNTLYLFAGGSTTILTASAADPTIWSVSPDVFPIALTASKLEIIGEKLYLFGGYNNATTGYIDTIFSASLSNPTQWTDTGAKLPTPLSTTTLINNGKDLYLVGGISTNDSTTRYIFRAPLTDPLTWVDTGAQYPIAQSGAMSVVLGNTVYILGGFLSTTAASAIYSAPISNPTTWTNTSKLLPEGRYEAGFVVAANALYMYGGSNYTTSNTSTIYRAPLTSLGNNQYNVPWATDLPPALTVTFGGTPALGIQVTDTSHLSVITPVHAAGTVDVTAKNPDGQTSTLAGSYTYSTPPTIATLTPGTGEVAGGDTVTITGSGFYGTPTVSFGVSAATGVTVLDDSHLTAIVPAAASAGSVDVIVMNENGLSATLTGGFDYIPTPPTITSISPAAGTVGGGTSVTITGANLTAATSPTVSFGSSSATPSIVNSTTATVVTPAHSAGSVDVTYIDSYGRSSTLTNAFTFAPAAYAFTNTPLTLAATEPGQLTLEARDGNGNPINSNKDITLTLSSDSATGFFARDLNEDSSTRWSYNSVVLPAGQSSVSFYYKDSAKGAPQITAIGPLGVTATQQITISSRYKLQVTGVTDPVAAGTPSSVTISAVDYKGTILTDYTGTISFTSTDGGAALPDTYTYTSDELGTHTFVNGVTMVTPGTWCVTATDTVDGAVTGSQCNIDVTTPASGTISKLRFISDPQSFGVDSHSSSITIQTQDSGNTPIPVNADTPIYLYSTSATGKFSLNGQTGWSTAVPFSATIKAGMTSVNIFYSDSATGTDAITARDDAGTGQDFGWTNDSQQVVVGVGAPSQLAIAGMASQKAGEWQAIQVELQDNMGNAVTSNTNRIVYLTNTAGDGQFSPSSNGAGGSASLTATLPAGSSHVTVYFASSTPADITLTASDANPADGAIGLADDTVSIAIVANNPTQIVFSSVPGSAMIYEAMPLRVEFRDIYGNVAPLTQTTTLQLSTNATSGGYSIQNDGPWNIINLPVSAGTTTVSFYYRSTEAAVDHLSVSGGVLATAGADVTITPAPGTVFRSSGAQTITAGQRSGAITITAYDAYDNAAVVSSDTNFTLTTSSSSGVFYQTGSGSTPITSVTIPAGQGTVTFYYEDITSGTPTVQAQSGVSAVTPSITVVAAAPSRLDIASAEQTIAKNTSSSPIVLQLFDAYDNPASFSSTTTINIASSSASGAFSPNGTSGWASVGSTSFPAGSPTAQSYYRESLAGQYTLTASGNGLAAASQTINVLDGIAEKLVAILPSSAQVGAATAFSIETRTASDIPAAVQQDTTVKLTAQGEFSLAASPWTPVTAVTIPSGSNSLMLFYKSTISGPNEIRAVDQTSSMTDGSGTILLTAGEFYQLAFTAGPASQSVTEASTVYTVSARDVYGNITAAQQDTRVYLYSTSPDGNFATNSGGPWITTDVSIPAGGSSATFYYKDNSLGMPTLTASDQQPLDSPDTGIMNATQTINVIGQTAAKYVITTPARSFEAGAYSPVVTVQAQKSDGSPAIQGTAVQFQISSDDYPVTFSTSNEAGTPSVATITIPAGASTSNFYMRSTQAGTASFTLTAGTMTASQGFIVTEGTPARVSFATPGFAVPAGQDSPQIKVRVTDSYGNTTALLTDTVLSLSSDCSTGEFSLENGNNWQSISTMMIPASGSDAYFYYRSSEAGTCTITASGGGLEAGQQSETINASIAVALQVDSAPQQLEAGQPSAAIRVSLHDVDGNETVAFSDVTLYLRTSSGGGSFSPSSSIVIPAGSSSATFTYRDSSLGTPTITIQDQSAATDIGLIDVSQQQTIVAGEPSALAITADTGAARAGEPKKLTISLRNQYNASIPSTIDTPVYVSTSDSGNFSADSAGNIPTTQVTIPAGSKTADIFYMQTSLGNVTLTASDVSTPAESPDTGLKNATTDLTVVSASFARVSFLTAPQQIIKGQSTTLTIQAEDQFGNPVIMSNAVQLYAYSGSSRAVFTGQGDTLGDTRIIIRAGSATATFSYQNTESLSDTITVSDMAVLDNPDRGITNASQNIVIKDGAPAKIHFTDTPASFERGGVSGSMSIELLNNYGVPTAAMDDTVIYLASSSTSGQFAAASNGPWGINTVTIPAGAAKTTVFYRDDIQLGQASLTASDVSSPPESPDTGLINGGTVISVEAGQMAQLAFTSPEQTAFATHTTPLYIEAQNQYGLPTTATTATRLYVRSSSVSGEFAASSTGSWGVNYVTLANGQSTAVLYYRDSATGDPNLTVSDNLPPTPDTGLVNATQSIHIEEQIFDHFLVTNVSDPQYQGSPSSIVVVAQDADNYPVASYDGTVSFSTAEDIAVNDASSRFSLFARVSALAASDTILPDPYTFIPSVDRGIHTFQNAVAFASAGEKTITVTDQNGKTGSQSAITVLGSTAGPVQKIVFLAPQPKLTTIKNQASEVITIQTQDAGGAPANVPTEGLPIRLATSSPTGSFATSPGGPWSHNLNTQILGGFNYTNFYYRDSQLHDATIVASDWLADSDNAAITNGQLPVEIRGLTITNSGYLQSVNYAGSLIATPHLFAYNDAGNVRGRAAYTFTAKNQSGQLQSADWSTNWRDGAGKTLFTAHSTNTPSITFDSGIFDAWAASDPYGVTATGTDTSSGDTTSSTANVTISPWTTHIHITDASASHINYRLDSFNATSRQSPDRAVLLLVNADEPAREIANYDVPQGFYKAAGSITTSLDTAPLANGRYMLVSRIFDAAGSIIAEDASNDFTLTGSDSSGTSDVIIGPDSAGGPVDAPAPSSPQVTPGARASTKPTTKTGLFATLGKTIRQLARNPAVPIVIPNVIFALILGIAVILLRQIHNEIRYISRLAAAIEREKAIAKDKRNFLALASHYLRTPVTILTSVVEMLQSKSVDQAEAIAALRTVSETIRQKAESIIQQTEHESAQLTANPEKLKQKRTAAYRSPLFWLPVAVSVVLTLATNWLVTHIGNQTLSSVILMEQILVGTAVATVLYGALRSHHIKKAQRSVLEVINRHQQALDKARVAFIRSTYRLLAEDVRRLNQLEVAAADNPAVAPALRGGISMLNNLIVKLETLSRLDPGTITKRSFTIRQLVDSSLLALSADIEKKRVRITEQLSSDTAPLSQDQLLLSQVIQSVVDNAIKFAPEDSTIKLTAKQSEATVTFVVSDEGPGLGKDPESLFQPFVRAADAEDFTHEGIGLSLYLDRIIMHHLHGSIQPVPQARGTAIRIIAPSI